MRIGLVVTGGVDRSGRERVIPSLLWLIERLARRHELHVFALRQYRDACTYPLLGATVHDLGHSDDLPGLGRFRAYQRLLAAVDSMESFDVLHAYWGIPAGWITTRVARRRGVPSVVTFDSGEFVALADIGYGQQRRWIDRRGIAKTAAAATRVTVCSRFMARLAERHGIAAEIVPLGVDAGAFSPAERAEGPPWRLLRVGSINRVKDYPNLLQTIARLVDRGADIRLDIVGEDTLGGAMQALARNLNLATRVTFHGFQPTDEVARFYARAHLHIVSSRHEAAEVVSLEAACAGIATVGTAVGYVADWAPDRAVAVPVSNPNALADAIFDLLRDASSRARIAGAARTWALAHDADLSAREFERIHAEVVARRLVSTT